MAQIPNPISLLRKGMEFKPMDTMPGAEMNIVRPSPTSALVKFKAGSVEPAHYHAFGYDLVVLKGRKRVWNLNKKESYELGEGDYLFTPPGDKLRAYYLEDTEFFLRSDGDWDMFLDESVEDAAKAIKEAELEESN